MLGTARILGILGGVLGLIINLGWASFAGIAAAGGITSLSDRVFSILWPIVAIVGGALVAERRKFGEMLASEIGGMCMLVGATGMAAFLGVKTVAAAPVFIAAAAAFVALIASDSMRAEQRHAQS